jgi:hypothetical protein
MATTHSHATPTTHRCEIGSHSSDPCFATAAKVVKNHRTGDELHACADCADECESHGLDVSVGDCHGCDQIVFESDRSADAWEADLVMHKGCVGQASRGFELPSMRG